MFHPRDRAASRQAVGRPSHNKRWILFVGRLEPQKGVPELLEAFARIAPSHPDVELVLVGDGVGRDEYRSLVEERGLAVHFAGVLPPEDVALWLGASDMLVLPSHNEGTPNAVLEALASGRRVVATRVGGIPAVVTHEILGELVAPRDPASLADALARSLAQPREAEEIAAKAQIHGWDDSARVLYGVLRRAAGAHMG